MKTYRCIMCDRVMPEIRPGWFYCADCDTEYSKIILVPESEDQIEHLDASGPIPRAEGH